MDLGVYSRYFPFFGGVEDRVYHLAKLLIKRGHNVTIYASREWFPSYEDFDVSDFDIVRAGYDYFDLVAWTKMSRKHDLLEGVSGYSWLAASLSGLISGTPTIATVHSIMTRNPVFEYTKLLNKMRNAIRESIFLPYLYSKYITPSLYLKSRLHDVANIPEDRIDVVPNGVDLLNYDQVEQFEKEDDQIVCLSRFEKSKHLEDAIVAMKWVIKEIPNAKLVIGGFGREYNNLQSLIRKLGLERHVKLVGKVFGEDKERLLKRGEIFVFPSTYEGFGIVLLEAFACNLPVVAVGVTAIPEIVRHNENGLLVPPRDPRSIADSLIHLLRNKDKAITMGKRGRSMVEKNYTWNLVGFQYLKILKKALK